MLCDGAPKSDRCWVRASPTFPTLGIDRKFPRPMRDMVEYCLLAKDLNGIDLTMGLQ